MIPTANYPTLPEWMDEMEEFLFWRFSFRHPKLDYKFKFCLLKNLHQNHQWPHSNYTNSKFSKNVFLTFLSII